MKRKRPGLWLLGHVVMVAVLLMAGCSPAAPAGAGAERTVSEPPGTPDGGTEPASGSAAGEGAQTADPGTPEPITELTATTVTLEPFRVPGSGAALVGPEGLYLAEVETGRVLRLYAIPYAAVSWSKDGRIALAHRSDMDAMDLLNLEAGTATRLSGVNPWEMALAPDGRLIAFTREGFRNGQTVSDGLHLVGTDGTGLRTVTAEEGIHWIRWSPDGSRLAFQAPVRDGAGRPWNLEVRVLDLASGTVTTLDPVYLGAYVWSPDGRQIALAASAGLTVVSLDTGSRREIPWSFSDGQSPVWSPDGNWFASISYTQGTLGWSLLSYPADGSGPLRTLAEAMPGMAWSPDGSRLAYVGFGCQSQDFGLYTIRPDGTDARRLSGPAPAPARTMPFWSPDGKTIASAVVQKVLLTDPVTGKERVLVQDNSAFWFARLDGWSPDGRYVVFANGVGKGYCD